MKVLFVAPPYVNLDKNAGGVFNEMRARERALVTVGAEVEYLSLDKAPDWESIDICHLFMANEGSYGLGQKLKGKKKLIVSPIIDRTQRDNNLKLFLNFSRSIPFLYSNIERSYALCRIADGIVTRSDEESDKVKNIYNINHNVKKIKIPFEFSAKDKTNKEDFVLFVGDIGNPRKNVKNLILACEEDKTQLVLAGIKSKGGYGDEVIKLVSESQFVTYLGKIDEDHKIELMKKAKVFALPSLMEGVGLSAMESLEFGCNLVVTKNGGVKDYFNTNAWFVNPIDVKDIKDKIFLAKKSNHTDFDLEELSYKSIGAEMLAFYQEVIND